METTTTATPAITAILLTNGSEMRLKASQHFQENGKRIEVWDTDPQLHRVVFFNSRNRWVEYDNSGTWVMY